MSLWKMMRPGNRPLEKVYFLGFLDFLPEILATNRTVMTVTLNHDYYMIRDPKVMLTEEDFSSIALKINYLSFSYDFFQCGFRPKKRFGNVVMMEFSLVHANGITEASHICDDVF